MPSNPIIRNTENMPILNNPTVTLCNSLPKENFLDWSKSKAFAADKINATEKLKFV